MKVLITGATGFVGTQLAHRLLARGDQVTIIDRSPERRPHVPVDARYICGHTTRSGQWQQAVAEQDALVNLAGASIFKRWTARRKQEIYESRIVTTRNLVDAIPSGRKLVLCSTSAVGFYGFRGDETVNEESGSGDDFLARVCLDWEKEARKAATKGARVVITRFGIVFGASGGALQQMLPAFNNYVGGPLGSGRQWMSWIHMEDLLRGILYVIDQPQIHGPVNLTAPVPVQNRTLAQTLGKLLQRPSFFKVPGFALKLAMGELGSVLLEGQRALPGILLEHGFEFQYLDLNEALRQILQG